MKLHHLRLTGIGPFAGQVEVDLAALGAGGIFLLEGPTGSGKSTLLDAIVYALYGSVAGSDTSGDRIRSQFADPTAASVVDLVFETGAGIYRIRREPDYQRAKKRGSGTTRQQARAILWRIGSPELIPAAIADRHGDGEGIEPLATRLDEVGREVQRAVGLSREQFTQTVLLPQNEFARFLRAGTAERQQVLQRVFGTEIYEAVEKQLEEMRKAAKREVDAARSALGEALARFAEATGAEQEARETLAAQAEALRLDGLAEQAEALLAEVTAQAEATREAAIGAREAETVAATAVETARAASALIARRRELDALRARLAEERPAVESARRELRRDEAVRPLAAALRRHGAALTGRDTARSELAEQVELARPTQADLAEACAGEHGPDDPHAAAALDAAAEEATAAAGRLADLARLEAELPERERTLAARGTEQQQARTALQERDEAAAARPAAREALVAARDAARAEAAALPDAVLGETTARTRHQAALAAARQQQAVTAAEDALRTAVTTARTAAETEAALRRRRFAGIAAELATGLEEGAPCPVCGAAEHPRPAGAAEDAVTPQQVEAAETERQRAEKEHTAAEHRLGTARSEHARLREEAQELGTEAAEAALRQAAAQVAAAREAEQRAARQEQALTAHDEETRSLARRREQDALALERLSTAITEQTTALEADRARIAEARGEDASIAERRRAHRERAAAAQALREALRALEQADRRRAQTEAEVTEAREAAHAALAAHEDAAALPVTEEAVAALVLESAARERHAEMLQRHAVAEDRLAQGLAEEGVAAADPSDQAREQASHALAAATDTHTAAQQGSREAAASEARARAVADRATAAREHLTAVITQVEAVGERAGVVVRIADLATGRSRDGERIQLSSYVLLRRFEDVIDAANVRLASFSGSDLELLRDTGARGARRTGLDLLVMDRRTDQVRVPETLSGGETFFVSLALALGLADIVAGEAGGVRMETLFIDEGFGSLDPQTLETVVQEIGRLAEHGRTIGIVSHVGDLAVQIPEQIHVRRGPDRTSTLTVTA